MKYLVIVAFIAIIASLGSALFFLMKNGANDATRSQKMARALAMRVGISILLFVLLLLAWRFGWIHPTGIAAGQ